MLLPVVEFTLRCTICALLLVVVVGPVVVVVGPLLLLLLLICWLLCWNVTLRCCVVCLRLLRCVCCYVDLDHVDYVAIAFVDCPTRCRADLPEFTAHIPRHRLHTAILPRSRYVERCHFVIYRLLSDIAGDPLPDPLTPTLHYIVTLPAYLLHLPIPTDYASYPYVLPVIDYYLRYIRLLRLLLFVAFDLRCVCDLLLQLR